MGNIVLLDDLTINKIAAGEVIERPASVVKELVENSIDAGATSITVEIKNGGISYIRITDNGKGFEKDDMEIAFERHATSKIRNADDLPKVCSMGFRGEALASIAAISRVELVSKTENSEVGNKIVLEGGKVLQFTEEGSPKGSTITIENLFFNTPVRYKFLKKDFTESGYIEDAITRIALAYPEIAIKLINTGKTVIQTSGNGDLKSVVFNIYGKEIAQNILDVDYEYEDIRVTGVIGNSNLARSNRSNQLFFVNKRFVKDKTLSAASEQAFKGIIPVGKFGFLVLNLAMDTQKVDVNVHPAKLEVRFEEESKVFKAIYHAIKDNLLKDTKKFENNVYEKQEEITLEKKDFSNVKPIDEYKEESTMGETIKIGLFQKLLNRNKAENKYENKFEKSSFEKIDDENNFIAQIYKNRNQENSENQEKDEAEEISITKENTENVENEEIKEEIKEEVKEEYKPTFIENIYKEEVAEKIEPEEIVVKEEIVEENKEEQNENVQDTDEMSFEETRVLEIPVVEEKIEEVPQNVEDSFEIDKEETIEEAIEKAKEENAPKEEIKEEVKVKESKDVILEKILEEKIEAQKRERKEQENKEKSVYENKNFDEIYSSIFGVKPKQDKDVSDEPEKYVFDNQNIVTGENLSIFEDKEEYKKIDYKFVGTAFKTCYLLEIGQDLYIIDQNQAKQKIIYEELRKDYYLNNLENKSQLMLLPDILDLNVKQKDIAKDNIDVYKKAGFEFEDFGNNTLKLTKVPDMCFDLDTKELFLETLEQINTVSMMEKEQIEEKLLRTIAKNLAKKDKAILSKEEAEELIDKLLRLPNAFVGENERTVAIKMTRSDLEKKFSRR